MSGTTAYAVRPVGYVRRRNKIESFPRGSPRLVYEFDEELRREEVAVEVKGEYCTAIKGLREGQLAWIIWYAHLSPENPPLQVHPYGDPRIPLTGVFATRSPMRPNNIMLSLTRITRIDAGKCTLYVVGTEAVDGTPVLDIKPYSHGLDHPDSIPYTGKTSRGSRTNQTHPYTLQTQHEPPQP